MALPKYPKFCNIHQVIHICENMDPMFKVKTEEAKLASKVRRLHGKQTEEELEAERQKSQPQKGSLAAILASAKENIKKEKSKLNIAQNDSDGDEGGKIDENVLSERMMALRAKTLGEPVQKPVIKTEEVHSNSPIEPTNSPTESFFGNRDTINSDYLENIKERQESMYSAVKMSELRKRPTAAIHLPKKRTSSSGRVKKIDISESVSAVKKPEPKVTTKVTSAKKTEPKVATTNKPEPKTSKTVKKTDEIKVEKVATTPKKSTSATTTVKINNNKPEPIKGEKQESQSKKDKPVFTKAETKKLIEEAVKMALKKVGKID